MKVQCIDDSANGREWLANGAIYEVAQADGEFIRLVETGPHWWHAPSRFRLVEDVHGIGRFLYGADIASARWDNRREANNDA